MTDHISRYVRVGEWLYEIKTVRAMRVSEYGMPYNGTVNFNFNADQAFVEGYMIKDESSDFKQDWQSFYDFGRLMGAKQINYQRYNKGRLKQTIVNVSENQEEQDFREDNILRLVP